MAPRRISNIKRVFVSGFLWEFSPTSAFRAYVNPLRPLRPPPPVGIRHFTPIDAIGVEFLAHNFPIRHAWICRLLRIILARLRLPAPHVRSAGPWKGGRGNPESLGSPPEDELPRQSALGRKSGIPTDRRKEPPGLRGTAQASGRRRHT